MMVEDMSLVRDQDGRVPETPDTGWGSLVEPDVREYFALGASLLERLHLISIDKYGLLGEFGEKAMVVDRGRDGRPERESRNVCFGENHEVCSIPGSFLDQSHGLLNGFAGVEEYRRDVACCPS
jgi:hypothetical protein